ncbi:MAG: Dabb family protein [Acidimicrobiaceae bacterium]|nr:Dabb family protein [Acidimicrobiaceae bacterium]
MLRRFEIYSIRDGVPPEDVEHLAAAFRRCGDHIPELRDSVVGHNLSDQPIHMVWEHAYDSPEAYQRYMVHPYHANVLDRYLLNDSPERIVTDGVLGDGALVGYSCDTPIYFLEGGVRKVVLFGLEGAEDFIEALRALPAKDDAVKLSVVEPNTFGVAWFDGVTPILPPSAWTHIWEAGFESLDAYEAYQRGDGPLAQAEREGWRGERSVRQAVELHYKIGETW